MIHFPKKRWGQNFLIDPNILRKIHHSIGIQAGEIIIEIGPGKGALTQLLIGSGAEIHAVEIDPDLIPDLQARFENSDNFILHYADALKFDFSRFGRKLRIVGNIPYNITSPLLFRLFEFNEFIFDIHFLVQKELGKRITALPNSRDYGILGVLSHYYGSPKILFDVSPQVFRPVPRVISSEISIRIDPLVTDKGFHQQYHLVVKTAFGKRRKTMTNSLEELLPADRSGCPLDLGRRPETLSPEEFIALTAWLFPAG